MVGPLLYSEAHEIAMRAKAEGYAEEFAREYAEGYAKGYAEEFAGGYARGYFRGQLKMLKKMAENAFISADEAERLEQEIRREAGELLKTTYAFKDEYV